VELVRELRGALGDLAGRVEVAVAPPFTSLHAVQAAVRGSGIEVAAQNVHWEAKGAFTGEVSAPMLAEVGCKHGIVGHSERRQLFGETDEQVAAKFAAARRGGLTPILCVGETLAEREAGRTEEVVARQLGAVLDTSSFENAVLAYEPVWAIGTGRNATPEQAQSVHAFLRKKVIPAATSILYGGSMKAANAAGLLAMPDIDGGLIGGASLAAEEFLAILRTAGSKRVTT
jgi:triosephosphate isomerase